MQTSAASAAQALGSGWLVAALALAVALFLPPATALLLPVPKRHESRAGFQRNLGSLICALLPPLIIAGYLAALQAGGQTSDHVGFVALIQATVIGLLLGALVYAFPAAFALCRASLATLPAAAVEAAKIDGASNWQIRWSLLWPHVRERLLGIALLLFCNVVVGFGFLILIGSAAEPARAADLIRGREYALALLGAAAAAGVAQMLRPRSGEQNRAAV